MNDSIIQQYMFEKIKIITGTVICYRVSELIHLCCSILQTKNILECPYFIFEENNATIIF